MKKLPPLPLPTRPPVFVYAAPRNSWLDIFFTFYKLCKRSLAVYCAAAFCSICMPTTVHGQVIISEVYPAPVTGESEWVELFNTGSTAVSLNGWKLQDKLSSPSDIFSFSSQIIEPQQFLVAELPSAKLNNSADGVTLYTNDGSTADTMDYTTSESAKSWQRTALNSTSYALTSPTKGSNSTQHSLLSATPTPQPSATPQSTVTPAPSPSSEPSPVPTSTSQTTATPVPGATPLTSTSPTPTPTALPTTQPTPTPTPSPSVPPVATPSPTPSPGSSLSQELITSLKLSEIMACPASGTEWVELFNNSTQTIQLAGWHITDESSTSKTITGTIESGRWAIFSWTGSLLNNSGDSFTIFTNHNQAVTQASFSECKTGTSLVYVSETGGSATTGEWLPTTPTPGSQNIMPETEADTTSSSSSTSTAILSTPLATTNALTALQTLTTPSILKSPEKNRSASAQALDLSSLFSLPNLKAPLTDGTAATPSTFIIKNPQPPKKAVFGGILSGLVTITSSGWVIYGKKITAIIAAVS